MVRARSPLFVTSFCSAVLLGVSGAVLLSTNIEPVFAMEKWPMTPAFGAIRVCAWILLCAAALTLIIIGGMELRIYHGWEPEWLRRFFPGCLVIEKYRSNEDLPGHMRLEVTTHDGFGQWFLLDPDEVHLCDAGDTVHLWCIGKHVAQVRVFEPSPISYPPKSRIALWSRISEVRQDGCAHMIMNAAPVLAGAFIGKGLEHLLSGEIYFSSSKRGGIAARVGTGWEAYGVGGLLFGIGLLGGIFLFYRWMKGWDDQNISSGELVDLLLTPGRSSWWWW